MGLFGRWGKRDDEDEKEVAERAARKAKEEARERKKEKKLEKERAVRELRARMPSLSQVGRNGVFEFAGYLNHTYAVGSIPGGSFLPVYTVIQGHVLYVFPGMERKPSAKPFAFFNIKRAEVEQLGLLQQNPPLPPYRNVFRINLTRNQFGHKSYFFQAPSARELEQWCADLSWRVKASEAQLEARFAPIPRARTLEARRLDDTEVRSQSTGTPNVTGVFPGRVAPCGRPLGAFAQTRPAVGTARSELPLRASPRALCPPPL